MSRLSQYTDEYLRVCAETPYTIGTFLSYRLRGKAKQYGGGYQRALQRSMDSLVNDALVIPCRSVHGRLAYRWRHDAS